MTALRRLSVAALLFAFGHIVFGALVRITGSGMGCGDNWPKCHGSWFPPLERTDLIIEVFHRYFAAGLTLMVVSLLALAVVRRRVPGVAGRGGVFRAAALASLLVIAAAVFGGITVLLEIPPGVVVVHHLLAMGLVAALTAATIRAGALGGDAAARAGSTARAARGATAALGLTFVVIALGGLTANLPGAAPACQGFPLCGTAGGGMSHVHLTHRIVAYLLFFHILALAIAFTRRGEPAILVRAAWLTFGVIVTQIAIAAWLVLAYLPLDLQSLHQAVGTLVWIHVVALALLARRSSGATPVPAAVAAARPGSGAPIGARATAASRGDASRHPLPHTAPSIRADTGTGVGAEP